MASTGGEDGADETASLLMPCFPNELAEHCLLRLPLDAIARCRVVSRSWASYLSQYRSMDPCHFLACFCGASLDPLMRSFFTWIFVPLAGSRPYVIPFYNVPSGLPSWIHAFSSGTQLVQTGTDLLLVRSRLQYTGLRDRLLSVKEDNACNFNRRGDHDYRAIVEPGGFQAFNLWVMKWCNDMDTPPSIPAMRVDRWDFANAQIGKYVYVAGGDGIGAANSAERLNVETGVWEDLPDMIRERHGHPAGFVLGGCFYVAGGEFQPTPSSGSQSMEFYNAERRTWTLLDSTWLHPPRLYGVNDHHVAVVKDVVYVAKDGQLMMLSEATHWRWRVRGKLPFCEGRSINMLSINDNQLWIVIVRDGSRLLFSCKPHFVGRLHWQQMPFVIPSTNHSNILSCLGLSF
ncbi:hypothetical protein KP509_24G035600 [Ceratopteris richardii]|uniref:F-box domain-containing protein n=1 Tax=Ceratopteris richardii TaxID=49495 RepID=A0A8T2RTZ2_CERRI|nr:hypothetical protein KP509_24G035600 [Ceratopteris richardii]